MAITISQTFPATGGCSAKEGEDAILTILGEIRDKAVTQPVSSTDNTVVRFNGVSGAIQTSNVSIDDNDNLIGVNDLIIKTNGATATPSTNQMAIYSKSDERVYRKGNIDASEYALAEDFKTGRVVPSLFFNGINANAVISDNDNLSFTTGTTDRPFSIICKVDNMDLGTPGVVGLLATKGVSASLEYTIRLSASNILTVYLYDKVPANSIQITMKTILPSPFSGIIGVTYDGSTIASGISLYLDGIKQNTNAGSSGTYVCMKNGTGAFYIGNREAGNYVRCEMSELMLFNRKLSDVEMSNYCYAGIAYSDVGASNTLLTSGSIVIGKRYKVIDAGTGIVINGAVQTLGSEIIATSASVTWNGGKVIQIGCVLDLSPDSINPLKWNCKNGLYYADLINAEAIGLPINHNANILYKGINGNANVTVPKGYAIEMIYIKNTTANAITGIKLGTTSGGTDVLNNVAISANYNNVIEDTVMKKFFSDTANTTLYIQAVTSWNSASLDLAFICRRAI